jgi:hypothetical protein
MVRMSSETMVRTPEAGGGYTLQMRGGKARVQELVPGVLNIRYQGIGHAAFVPEIQRGANQRIREGLTVTICVDASELVSYDTEFRKKWTSWFAESKGHYHQVLILFRSSLVRMGINLVNPLIGNMILPFTERSEYEASVQRAIARARNPTQKARIA